MGVYRGMSYRLVTSLAFVVGMNVPLAAHASESPPASEVPVGFSNFVGTWTLKNDEFRAVWDGETEEAMTIPNHITVCTSETTASSVSCAVDGGGLTGQIFWVADDARQTLQHLSHFGETRRGVGTGSIAGDGSLTNRIVFSDEPDGTYRIYQYSWVTPDEYIMMSRQYGADDTPTGNWYGGTFVRVAD